MCFFLKNSLPLKPGLCLRRTNFEVIQPDFRLSLLLFGIGSPKQQQPRFDTKYKGRFFVGGKLAPALIQSTSIREAVNWPPL
jgi:hypothetical protein